MRKKEFPKISDADKNSNEKYCDSMVPESLGGEESNVYGKALVRLAWKYRKGIVGLASAISSGAATLKERIRNIAGFRRGACRWSITAVLILALAACSGISNEIDDHRTALRYWRNTGSLWQR
jgi:beta-lactamase regulating signal transducer with metallopeptidase domain